MSPLNIPVFQQKINKPFFPDGLVSRDRLFEKLDVGKDRRLTLIAAPAGYGKTALAYAWVNRLDLPCAWLSLDNEDNDLIFFIQYFIAGIRTEFPHACSRTLAFIQMPTVPSFSIIVAELIAEICEIRRDFLFVLDDYHVIYSTLIHRLITRILELSPVGFHLLIICRQDPPIPLSRIRSQQLMNEIRTEDLRFTLDETREFLAQKMNLDLPAEAVTILLEKTEGWITGLQLAAFSMQGQVDPTGFVEDFNGSSKNVADYLMDEAFSQQSPMVKAFLLKTSLLQRFCAPLCEALLDEGKVTRHYENLLRKLEKNNLFIVSLDNQREWFRYQQLFREILLHRLNVEYSSTERDILRARAVAWLKKAGLITEALTCALEMTDLLPAALLVEENIHPVLDRGDWYLLDRWINLLPAGLVRQRPALILARAWVFSIQFKLPPIISLISEAEDLIRREASSMEPSIKDRMLAEITILKSVHLFVQEQSEEIVSSLQEVLQILPGSSLFARCTAIGWLAFHLQLLGQEFEAIHLLNQELESGHQSPMYNARILLGLANINRYAGKLNELQVNAQSLLRLANEQSYGEFLAWGHYLLGVVAYEKNDLDNAYAHFRETSILRYAAHFFTYRDAMIGFALTCMAQGKIEQAGGMIERLNEFSLEIGDRYVLATVRSFQARMALAQGDLIKAKQCMPPLIDGLQLIPSVEFEISSITQACILVAEKTEESLKAAVALLEVLHRHSEDIHSKWILIQILALEALAFHAQGRIEQATGYLENALQLAEPDGFIRVFVDLGPEMANLIRSAPDRIKSSAYVRSILSAFPGTVAPPSFEQLPANASAALIEPLTNREMEIFRLISQRLTCKEIAAMQVLSPLTVKKHISNIYQKFGVHGRQQLINKARDLGFLPPS